MDPTAFGIDVHQADDECGFDFTDKNIDVDITAAALDACDGEKTDVKQLKIDNGVADETFHARAVRRRRHIFDGRDVGVQH